VPESLFVFTTVNWLVSEVRETLLGVNNGNQRYIHVYIFIYIVRQTSFVAQAQNYVIWV